MKLGYAEANITPVTPVNLAGYGVTRTSNDVHDPLILRTLVFSDGHKDTVLIQTDLVGVDACLIDMLADRLGINKDQIMICCSHTHSGPTGTIDLKGLESIFGEFDQDYVDFWLESAVKCYKQAKEDLSITKVGYRLINVTGIGTDRHDGTQGDDRLGLWYFTTNNNKKILLYNFACHPTIMNSENLLITADLPYGVITELGNEFDGIMFLNGSAGDISTRYTRNESNFEEVYKKGRLIGQAIKSGLSDIEMVDLVNIQINKIDIDINLKEIPDIKKIEAKLVKQEKLVNKAKKEGKSVTDIRVLYSVVEGYNAQLEGINVLTQLQHLKLNVTYLQINDKVLIGLPVELFSKLSDPYKEQDSRLHFVSYCNGYYMYLTNEIAFTKNYYEAGTTIFAKGEGERIMHNIYQNLPKIDE